jgi:hypothetical protein
MDTPASTSAFGLALSSWGAVVSTALAGIKAWEVWRDRFRVELNYSFTGSADHGNRISIHNLSVQPLILTHWELLYGNRNARERGLEHIYSSDFESPPRTIDSHATLDLLFTGEQHFEWGVDFLKGRSVYLRMHFAGRKPVLRLVYPTSSE